MIYSKNEEIASSELDGEVCIFDPNSGMYFNLNDTASFIWQLIEKRTSLESIMSEVKDKFDGDYELIEKEVIEFLKSSVKKGLLITSND